MFLFLFFLSTAIASIEVPSFDTFLKQKHSGRAGNEESKINIISSFFQDNSFPARPECPDRGVSKSANGIEANSVTTTETVVEKKTPIIITNAIEPSMLAYKHWTGTYTPDIFTVHINGTEVAQGTQHKLIQTEEPVEISFHYSFKNGTRKGSKTVSYKINENSTHAAITFSWKDEWKLLVSNATPLKEIKT